MSLITSLLALVSAGLILGCIPQQNTYNTSSISPVSTVVDEYATTTTDQLKTKKAPTIIAATKEAAKAKLKDPSSVQFRNVRIVSWGSQKVVCGEINAKNSYGGYVGFKKFVGSPLGVTMEPVSTIRISDYDSQTLRDLNQACGG